MKYFLVISARSMNDPDSEITLHACFSGKVAHSAAAEDFRNKRKLSSNIHVLTRTLHTCDTAEEAEEFYNRLLGIIKEKEASGLV